MKLVVFSICKDEADTIGKVLDGVPSSIPGIATIQKLVISDGSVDKTAEIAKQHGAQVIEGMTQKRLARRFEQALDWVLADGADIAVNIDGDLQFDPKDIPKLIEPIIAGQADFVAADRFTNEKTGKRKQPENMPSGKYLANRIGAWIVGKMSGYAFRDVTCGYRAYNRRAMIALNINSSYTYTQESFQLLAMKKFDIASIPVQVRYYSGRKSRVVTNFMQFLINSSLNILRSFRDFEPLKFFFFLGFFPFVLGLVSSGFVFWYWLENSAISPYKGLGIFGIYATTLGIIIWVVGLVADMLDRNNKNQEKILEQLKRLQYREKK